MSIGRVFCADLKATKQIAEEQIVANVEGVLEEEREEGFVEGSLDCCDEILALSDEDKDLLRENLVKDLQERRFRILGMIELFINRWVFLQIAVDVFLRIGTIIAIIALALKCFVVAIVLFLLVIQLMIISSVDEMYSEFSYVFIGGRLLIDRLLIEYYFYGKTEAKIALADRHGFSPKREQKRWVYTSTHKAP